MNLEMIAKINTVGEGILVGTIIAFLIVAVPFMIVGLFHKRFKGTWWCEKMGWHFAPMSIGFDGCSQTGQCPRCHKDVMQDGQGNWF